MMKKVISILLIAVMFAAIACAGVSAEVRFYDPFDTWTSYWFGYDMDDHGGDLNELSVYKGENVLEGWEEARVHQGMYSDNKITGKGYENSGSALTTGTVWVDLRCEDMGNEAGAGLWWKNTYHETHEDAEDADTFTLFYYPHNSTVVFSRDFPGASTDEEKIIIRWTDPKGRGNNLDNPITLGLRVESGKISAFVDGEWIASYDDAGLGVDPCPILLWNNALHAIWDNFYVGDLAELPLPGNASNNGGSGNNGGNGAPAPIETVIVTDTDAEGNVVTRVETREAANTQNGGTAGGNAASTGDMAVVVVAVMVIALGSAIVVKKITSK
jgi:hypothetical protein